MYGARGTSSLIPEQTPGRKLRGRAQPYRKRKPRVPGPTLDAMLKGAPKGLANPAAFRNAKARRFARAYGRGR